jgi:NAD-dependent DNA ligase
MSVTFEGKEVTEVTPELRAKSAGRLIELYTRMIRIYQKAYYQRNESWVTDYEFDVMLKNLGKLEDEHPQYYKEDSPTNTVGN